MAKRHNGSLGGMLNQAAQGMSPAQISAFRAELIKRLPQLIEQAAAAAKTGSAKNPLDLKGGNIDNKR